MKAKGTLKLLFRGPHNKGIDTPTVDPKKVGNRIKANGCWGSLYI